MKENNFPMNISKLILETQWYSEGMKIPDIDKQKKEGSLSKRYITTKQYSSDGF